jgi:hypothetical protein
MPPGSGNSVNTRELLMRSNDINMMGDSVVGISLDVSPHLN